MAGNATERRPGPADHRSQQRHRRGDGAGGRRRPTGWCWRRGGWSRWRSWPRSSAARSGRWPCAATSPSGTRWRRWPRRRSSASAGSTPSSPTPASAPRAASSRSRPSTGARWSSPTSTGAALTIRATLPHLLERGDGHFLDHQLGRRAGGRCPARSTRRPSGRRPRSARRCAPSCARCTRTTRSASP